VSVGEVEVGSRAVAERLGDLVPPGLRVATCMPPGRSAVETIFGLARLGAVEVPLPPDLPPSAARAMARAAEVGLTVLSPEVPARNSQLVTALGEVGPVLVADSPADAEPVGLPWLAELPRRRVDRPAPGPGDPIAIMSTSGTTGRSKAAVLPHFAAVRQASRVAAAMGYGPGDVVFNVFPWNHINVRHAALLPALLSGARLVAHRRFSASRFWDICRAEGVTAFNFMGAMLAILERSPPGPGDRRHSVRLAYGAPAPSALAARVLERFGVRALEAYACTELADVAVSTEADWRPGTAGRVVPEYEVAILDDDGRPLPRGAVGQIAARPRMEHISFLGYAGDPAATAAVVVDGWFRTGDRGRLDGDGYLSFAGRRADVVRRRGENVPAWDVEQVVLAMPGVVDAAVVGVDSELTEQEVLVAVVPRPGAGVDGPAVRAWCRGRLPQHALPRYVRVLADLPRTPNGKVVKRVLSDTGVAAGTWDAGERPGS
jgi:crotonobetaine/carnitine-CoA ligase